VTELLLPLGMESGDRLTAFLTPPVILNGDASFLVTAESISTIVAIVAS